jgi:hypothetical protein
MVLPDRYRERLTDAPPIGSFYFSQWPRREESLANMDDWMAQFRTEIIALAKENYRLLDGTINPIKQIIRDNEVVFGVFPDPLSEDGAGLCMSIGFQT